ncbi:hypothetical protein [Psychroserpens sp.]|uniref:hypothetical protein n=1 Tax=Psychroserpens sp. TaxID=2020870 RepID=UPI0039E394F5
MQPSGDLLKLSDGDPLSAIVKDNNTILLKYFIIVFPHWYIIYTMDLSGGEMLRQIIFF